MTWDCSTNYRDSSGSVRWPEGVVLPVLIGSLLRRVGGVASKPDFFTWQAERNVCLYYTSGIEWNSGKRHARTRAHTASWHCGTAAFSQQLHSKPAMPFQEGSAFRSPCRNPPPSVFRGDHDADLATSKYLLWLPMFSVSLPFQSESVFFFFFFSSWERLSGRCWELLHLSYTLVLFMARITSHSESLPSFLSCAQMGKPI